MNFFSFDLRKVLLGLFLVAVPLVLLNVDQDPEDTAWYKLPFHYTSSWMQRAYAGFSHGIRDTTAMYLDLVGINKEIRKLQGVNQELLVRLQQMEEMRSENQRLAELLDFQASSPMKLLPAKVVARDVSGDHSTIFINRGTDHGVKKLQAVISTKGVVGYIFEPLSRTSQVLLLTDRAASIDAIVQRTRARGIVSGRNMSNCRLRYLERPDDVKAGDLIVTSGLQGYFPQGFPIGQVTSVRKADYGISVEAFVEPKISPSKLEEVFIVLDTGEREILSGQAQLKVEGVEDLNSQAPATTN